MGDRDWGNRAVHSTQATATNPSTTTRIAAIDSTRLGTASYSTSRQKSAMVTWIVGGSTRITVRLRHVDSSSNVVDGQQATVWISTAGSAQYQFPVTLARNDRLDITPSSAVTGLIDAHIVAEVVT